MVNFIPNTKAGQRRNSGSITYGAKRSKGFITSWNQSLLGKGGAAELYNRLAANARACSFWCTVAIGGLAHGTPVESVRDNRFVAVCISVMCDLAAPSRPTLRFVLDHLETAVACAALGRRDQIHYLSFSLPVRSNSKVHLVSRAFFVSLLWAYVWMTMYSKKDLRVFSFCEL